MRVGPAGIGGFECRTVRWRSCRRAFGCSRTPHGSIPQGSAGRSFASRRPAARIRSLRALRKLRPEFGELRLLGGRAEGFRPRRGRLVAARTRLAGVPSQAAPRIRRVAAAWRTDRTVSTSQRSAARSRPLAEGRNARPARFRLRSAAGSAEIARSGGPPLRPAKARAAQPTGLGPRL